jgi:murein DD-endopeptidase MepM/ murein hydrolase activator NlpD
MRLFTSIWTILCQHYMILNTLKSKLSILTQNLFLSLRNIKLRWLLLLLLLSSIGAVAAFSPTSQVPSHVGVKTVEQILRLPPTQSVANPDEIFWQIDRVRRDDTLANLLKRMHIDDDEAVKFLMTSADTHALNRKLQQNHAIEVKSNLAGKLLHLKYELDAETVLTAMPTDKGFQANIESLALQNRTVLKSATIRNSLFGATDDAGISDKVALQIVEIFSTDIDFREDLRPGDKFNVIYEAFYSGGQQVKTGDVLAVEFVNKGKVYQAIHFGDATGKFAYYTPDGKGLHKSFLRSPIEFTRVSSTFSTGRFHPILNRIRAHDGVDLAAPMGTGIKASGDGVVEFLGRKGGYGNVIVLKHANGISTVYGHLSKFADGLHKGDKVEQGVLIGAVGMTGLATGPHLHYEFLVDGVHKDPLSLDLPIILPIDAEYKKKFDDLSASLMAQIDMLQHSQVAAKD